MAVHSNPVQNTNNSQKVEDNSDRDMITLSKDSVVFDLDINIQNITINNREYSILCLDKVILPDNSKMLFKDFKEHIKTGEITLVGVLKGAIQ